MPLHLSISTVPELWQMYVRTYNCWSEKEVLLDHGTNMRFPQISSLDVAVYLLLIFEVLVL